MSTGRAGNLFSADEDIVLKTIVTGPAHWTLTNDYGERIEGTASVSGGQIRISTYGLRYGRYTFAIEGDGEVVGGVVPPLMQIHPDLCALIFAPFRLHWDNPEEALLWKQLGAWEIRFEYGLDGINPEKGVYKFDPAIEEYMAALFREGVRPSFKVNRAPRWNTQPAADRRAREPIDYAEYAEALRQYARHYRRYGLDRYYIVNEPDGGTYWKGGQDGYYRFLDASAKALKEVDPSLLVIGPNSWSFRPEFVDPVLRSGNVDIVSGHYTVEKIIGNVHGYFYLTRMRKTGVYRPFINAEDTAAWRNLLDLRPVQKNYPGIPGPSSVLGIGPIMMATLDSGVYRTVTLHLRGRGDAPFAKWAAGDVVPDQLCFQYRAASDEFAGVQYRRRLNEAPPTVLASLYRRGNDNYLGAYVPVGQVTQMMEITTSSRRLRMVDTFGNEQTAEPVDGKVRLLLTNADVYVHGLRRDDKFAFMPHSGNEKPSIADPGGPVAVVGVPFRFRLDGRDPDSNLLKKLLPQWKLVRAPEGMSIRPGSGLIEWLPKKADQVQVEVSLTDPDGAVATRKFAITVRPAGTPLPLEFVSRPAPVAVKGGPYRYRPVALDSAGGEVSYSVEGPAGMRMAGSEITWTPDKEGIFPVRIRARSTKRGEALQTYEVAVEPNPDRPAEGVMPPREPTDLTVTETDASGVTLVWNAHSFADHVVQRAPKRSGPWQEIAVGKANFYRDMPSSGPVCYRVLSRNSGGDSDPTDAVNGRDRVPVADAGPSFKLDTPGTVTLDGSGSMDPEGKPLRHEWTIVNAPQGSRPALKNASAVRPAFSCDQPGRYTVGLVVSDGEETSLPDYLWVVIGVDPLERVAYAGPDRFATVGEPVNLKPVAGTPAREIGEWFWRWDDSPLDGYEGIRDHLKESASFTAEIPGVYWFNLWAADGGGDIRVNHNAYYANKTYGYPDTVRIIVGPK